MKLVRAIRDFFLNLLFATVATSVITSPLWRYSHFTGFSLFVPKAYIFSALAAFGLGYLVYRTWRESAAKWVWVAGFCWLGSRAILLWFEQRAMLFGSPHTVFGQMSGFDCNSTFAQSCMDLIDSTIPFVRTIFYSAGAICCSLANPLPHGQDSVRGTAEPKG